MTIYDNLIKQIKNLLPAGKRFSVKKTNLEKGSKNSILFAKDTAYELGGSQKPCVSTVAVTGNMKFDNCITLIGKDLFEIKEDSPFGKIVFIETNSIETENEDDAFAKIKELETLRYNFYLDGFMTRASALNMREQIRVSKKTVKNKISFADYGSAVIEEYLKNPAVKSIEIIFITEFDKFDELTAIAEKIKNTTSALNHILDNVMFDCSACSLKEICDEVEGMKELHMKKAKNNYGQ